MLKISYEFVSIKAKFLPCKLSKEFFLGNKSEGKKSLGFSFEITGNNLSSLLMTSPTFFFDIFACWIVLSSESLDTDFFCLEFSMLAISLEEFFLGDFGELPFSIIF
eukprot:NODE_283_length_10814_cov_0.705460.p15 type:complete len:107 gc:universal NODE_283_length_10814_cov_0.705460:3565-3245(-)